MVADTRFWKAKDSLAGLPIGVLAIMLMCVCAAQVTHRSCSLRSTQSTVVAAVDTVGR
jgi:hypothetical protein